MTPPTQGCAATGASAPKEGVAASDVLAAAFDRYLTTTWAVKDSWIMSLGLIPGRPRAPAVGVWGGVVQATVWKLCIPLPLPLA
jgi:hypothetical protein